MYIYIYTYIYIYPTYTNYAKTVSFGHQLSGDAWDPSRFCAAA